MCDNASINKSACSQFIYVVKFEKNTTQSHMMKENQFFWYLNLLVNQFNIV